ncbi:MAG: type IX secretion system membrane protein PorP/SprF [Algoriphagus sp.]|jgi:type IX secretion system PorP/SprF family membrane protein|uniref:PorP/SprF family type IX secretion system membrane protein n=1 Tax=Algoriphagus sp. TaxID=1872435 RepID=UPI002723BE78|nr:type IX secretion system membrane protein PorP/SprF [Algoriphagus sp.]MDO8968513.1 type IX secretion system membrane protein PorP/SprF [Algoriphagus sp.]MDP2041044.1 type IX secretion system membrane protein PorP/SprF [Algoriphagus sp.]MDP3200710.1 type IX secretion system membrane protein PorP/SprF [Algoriphagus sp.]MDP3470457.1 type IX secretion system membrane protein PorP/SprF [Algoriphagus sp.]
MNTKSRLDNFLKIGIVLILLLNAVSAYGQQDAQFTQYMYNGMFYNPALAGKEGGYRFSVLHRSQWINYTTSSGQGGAPITQLITAEGRLEGKNIGYGLSIVNDQIGAAGNLEINLKAGYHKKINRATLSFGGYAGIFSSSLDYGEIIVVNPEPTLPNAGKEGQLALDFGAGILYDRGHYYLGLSSKHLNQPAFDFGDGAYANQLKNHSYVLFGYRIRPIGQLRIEPSLLIKTVSFNNFSYDVSVMATHQNKINAGLAYRGEESISLILGYSLLRDNSLKLGYAFDLVTGGLDAKSPTSHELMLRYVLSSSNREIERVIQRTPRFRF